MSIGRLDQDSEGLLLLTTDGKVSARVRSKTVEKEYYVQVDGDITPAAIQQLREGVTIYTRSKGYTTLPGEARRLDPAPIFPPRAKKTRAGRHRPSSWLSITLTEGKFRQVRKMTAAVGFPTLRLIRVRIGGITLGALPPGHVREVEDLRSATDE